MAQPGRGRVGGGGEHRVAAATECRSGRAGLVRVRGLVERELGVDDDAQRGGRGAFDKLAASMD